MLAKPSRHPFTCVGALLLALFMLPLASAGAQGVRGTVTQVATGDPVQGAVIELVPLEGQALVEPVVSEFDGTFLITTPRTGRFVLRVSFPGYRTQVSNLPPLSSGRILEVRINLASAPDSPDEGQRHVQGRVMSSTDGGPLTDVLVRVLDADRSTRTDSEGRFTLRDVPADSITLTFQRLGIAPDTLVIAGHQGFVTMQLTPAAVMLPAVEATARNIARERFDAVAQTSTVSINREDVEGTPTLAEPDLARTVQLLAGTVTKNDYYIGFNVRGGEANQNLIRLDGITVFNPSHVGGVFSTFDENALDRVDFMTGGFPAQYGGRLSSVLDVRLRPGNQERTQFSGHVSLLSTKLAIEGPIGNTGITYLASVRRSYIDVLAGIYTSFAGGPGVPYYFTDALARFTIPLPTGGTANVTGYWGNDQLNWPFIESQPGRDGLDLQFGWGNRLAGLTVRHIIGAVDFEQHLSITQFDTRLALVPNIRSFDNGARLTTFGTSANWAIGTRTFLTIGGDVEDYYMDISQRSFALETVDFALTYRPRIWSGYADLQLNIFDRFQLRPGIRVDRVERGVDKTFVGPRVAAKAFLTNDIALTASAGRYYQAIHSIRDQDVPLTMFDFWIGADDLTPVAHSNHLIAGIEKWFDEDVSVGIEGYNKQFFNLVFRSFRDDPKVRGDEFFQTDGYARGFDIFVRKYTGKITGWVAYSYLKTLRTSDSLTFAPSHDRRHSLNVVVQAPGPFGSQMGVRLGYGSPLPYTGIVGQWLHRNYNSELHAFDYSERESVSVEINGERFPAYGRLDIGFRWIAYKWGGELRPYFNIVNVFNRSNVWVYAFDFDRSPATRSRISQLPLFPTVGVEFAF